MTVAGETHRCPPHEVLAAFIDARLPKTQVVALTEHLATCAECRFVVESASELEAEEQAESVEPQRRRSWRWLAVAAVVGVGVWLTPMARTGWQAYQIKTAKLDLAEAIEGQKMRPIEARLTGFEYGEKPPVNRGKSESSNEQWIIKIKAQTLIDRTKDDKSPAAAHERGIGELISGQVDAAILDLKIAAASNDARAWSDLSAAYYAKKQYVEANDAANRAIKIDPNLSDAWFNRAFAVAGIALTDPVVQYRWAKKTSSPSAEYAPLTQEPLVQMIADGKATEVLRQTEGNRTPDAMHARGIAHLVLKETTEAVDELTAVAKARPDDARIWSDLAAALLENREYKKALDAARRAHYLDSLQPEAKAILNAAYQRSGDAEIAAWNDYLKHDSTSRWANEAREKLKGLQEPS